MSLQSSDPLLTDESLILVIEDSHQDFTVLMRIMKQFAFTNPVYHIRNGDDALDYLYRREQYSDPTTAPRPALILLDLNLPGTDGREIIRQLKQDSALKRIPIVVLTTSSSPRDIEACYQDGANSYLLKSMGMDTFREHLRIFFQYWFGASILPGIGELSNGQSL